MDNPKKLCVGYSSSFLSLLVGKESQLLLQQTEVEMCLQVGVEFDNCCLALKCTIYEKTRLITMRSKPGYFEVVIVVVFIICSIKVMVTIGVHLTHLMSLLWF